MQVEDGICGLMLTRDKKRVYEMSKQKRAKEETRAFTIRQYQKRWEDERQVERKQSGIRTTNRNTGQHSRDNATVNNN